MAMNALKEKRGVLTREEAEEVLEPHVPLLWECLQQAWEWLEKKFDEDPTMRLTVVGRTRANMVYDKFVDVAENAFTGVDGVEVSWDRSFLRLLFNGRISLRFKKLNKAMRSSNVRTNAQRTIYFQLEIDSFPPAPTEVTFGYVLDAAGAKIERVCLTCPIGWSLNKWVIPVMEPPADSSSLFAPSPQPEPATPVIMPAAGLVPPLVMPKRSKKTKKAE